MQSNTHKFVFCALPGQHCKRSSWSQQRMTRRHLTKLVLNRAGIKPPLPGGLGAGTETTGTMLGSALLPRPPPKPVSIGPLAAWGEPREKSERKYPEIQSPTCWIKHTANWPRISEGNVCCTIFFVAAGAVLLQKRLRHSQGALAMARPSLADANCLHWQHQSIFTGATLHFYSFLEWFMLPEQCTMAHRVKSGALPFPIMPCSCPCCLCWGPAH